MAHWAELDQNNIVTRVLVTDNTGDEGYGFLVWAYGGRWLKTSYNTHGGVHKEGGTPFRKNFAGIGYYYDEERDAFIPPKPADNAIFDEETCLWTIPAEE